MLEKAELFGWFVRNGLRLTPVPDEEAAQQG